MGVQTELTRIANAKSTIKEAIESKGVTVPDGTLLDGMGALIGSIEAGGGGVDTSQDTVTASVLAEGYTAHNANGELIEGIAYPDVHGHIRVYKQSGGTITLDRGYSYYKYWDFIIAFHLDSSSFVVARRKKAKEYTWVMETFGSSGNSEYITVWDEDVDLVWAVSPDISINDNTDWLVIPCRVWR